jgi:hypothetical protein
MHSNLKIQKLCIGPKMFEFGLLGNSLIVTSATEKMLDGVERTEAL